MYHNKIYTNKTRHPRADAMYLYHNKIYTNKTRHPRADAMYHNKIYINKTRPDHLNITNTDFAFLIKRATEAERIVTNSP